MGSACARSGCVATNQQGLSCALGSERFRPFVPGSLRLRPLLFVQRSVRMSFITCPRRSPLFSEDKLVYGHRGRLGPSFVLHVLVVCCCMCPCFLCPRRGASYFNRCGGSLCTDEGSIQDPSRRCMSCPLLHTPGRALLSRGV